MGRLTERAESSWTLLARDGTTVWGVRLQLCSRAGRQRKDFLRRPLVRAPGGSHFLSASALPRDQPGGGRQGQRERGSAGGHVPSLMFPGPLCLDIRPGQLPHHGHGLGDSAGPSRPFTIWLLLGSLPRPFSVSGPHAGQGTGLHAPPPRLFALLCLLPTPARPAGGQLCPAPRSPPCSLLLC